MRIAGGLAFLLLVNLPASIAAEPAETHFGNWLAAFNSGEKAKIQEFYGKHLDDADALTARNLRAETCGFDLARIENDSDETFSALLIQRCFPALFRVSFSVAENGQTLEDFSLQPFAMSEARTLAATQDIADRLAALDAFAGSIIVAHDDEQAWTYAAGTFSRQDPRPITPNTPMFLASAGKMFTAVGILQLVEKGEVRLDDPLSQYLPDYPNREMSKVTIRQLLSHRGGTGEDAFCGARTRQTEPGSERSTISLLSTGNALPIFRRAARRTTRTTGSSCSAR